MKYLPWILFGLAFLVVGITARELASRGRELEISQANVRAALDTTRITLRDSVVAATRLAVQERISKDSISGVLAVALQDRRASLVAFERLKISFDSLIVVAQTPVTDTVEITGTDTVRVATFDMEGPPIQGSQTVRIGPRVTLDSRLAVSPFEITYGLACAERAPVYTWGTPDWVRASFLSGTVDPVVCNPPLPSLFSFGVSGTIWAGVGGGVTLILMLLFGGI